MQKGKEWSSISRDGAAIFVQNTTAKVFADLAQDCLGMTPETATEVAKNKDRRKSVAVAIVQKSKSPYDLLCRKALSTAAIVTARRACGDDVSEGEGSVTVEDDSADGSDDPMSKLSKQLQQQCQAVLLWEQEQASHKPKLPSP